MQLLSPGGPGLPLIPQEAGGGVQEASSPSLPRRRSNLAVLEKFGDSVGWRVQRLESLQQIPRDGAGSLLPTGAC